MEYRMFSKVFNVFDSKVEVYIHVTLFSFTL